MFKIAGKRYTQGSHGIRLFSSLNQSIRMDPLYVVGSFFSRNHAWTSSILEINRKEGLEHNKQPSTNT